MKAIKIQERNHEKALKIMDSICHRIASYRRNNQVVLISRYSIGEGDDERVLKGIVKSDIIEGKGPVEGNSVPKQAAFIRGRMKAHKISVMEVIGGWRNCCLAYTIINLLHPF